ncbi:hypothetical protein Tco_1349364, partial [Tanacetum coccineum]
DGEGVDWTNHSEDEDYALMACNGSHSDTEVNSCSTKCKESYAKLKKLYDAQREQLSDASVEIKAYSQGLKKVEAQLVAHQQGQLWQEKEANEEAETLKKKFKTLVIQEEAAKTRSTNIFSTISTPANASSTNLVNTVSIPVSTASPNEGLSLSDPSN